MKHRIILALLALLALLFAGSAWADTRSIITPEGVYTVNKQGRTTYINQIGTSSKNSRTQTITVLPMTSGQSVQTRDRELVNYNGIIIEIGRR